MKTILHTQFRLSAAAALLILIGLDNHAGAQQFYDHGRQWNTVQSGSSVPEDYYRHAVRVEGPITARTPPFGYYAAPRPKEVYRVNWNEVYATAGYGPDGLSPGLNRSRTRPRPQVDAYGRTSGHLYIPGENAAATATPAGTYYKYESTDLNGSLRVPHAPISETRQTVSAKLYRPALRIPD